MLWRCEDQAEVRASVVLKDWGLKSKVWLMFKAHKRLEALSYEAKPVGLQRAKSSWQAPTSKRNLWKQQLLDKVNLANLLALILSQHPRGAEDKPKPNPSAFLGREKVTERRNQAGWCVSDHRKTEISRAILNGMSSECRLENPAPTGER